MTIPFSPACECGKTNKYRFVISVTNQPIFDLTAEFETSTNLVDWADTNFTYRMPATGEKRFFRLKR